ncbi:hypothetical protein GWI33_019516 [Rhynchophorus ferrugineus]|uniref:Uncharacterized protein n=1 Tax=Rhynchophorus ferrugineus TaxID=354439 RepID=A0A834HSQ1_RHYFE|nr:hypothetical protein GWI33_019516 [Rhynchophorus ferrugineus]
MKENRHRTGVEFRFFGCIAKAAAVDRVFSPPPPPFAALRRLIYSLDTDYKGRIVLETATFHTSVVRDYA